VSKFLGKFRKNKDYNDDSGFTKKPTGKKRKTHTEIKKHMKNFEYDKFFQENETETVYMK
jgi:hypothetical protein